MSRVIGIACGIGRTHAGTHVKLLIHDLDVIVINATTGELLRELTINLERGGIGQKEWMDL